MNNSDIKLNLFRRIDMLSDEYIVRHSKSSG